MGVYIAGMEMPKSCFDCNFCVEAYEGAGVYSCVVSDKCVCRGAGRHDDCPLVPVPKHGRLIDADALEYHADNVRDPMGRTEKTVMWKKIESAQTILPAEEGE